MSSDGPRRASPLDRFFVEISGGPGADGAAATISERPALGYLNLRCGPDGAARASAALGLKLPAQPNTTACGGEISALWLGPDEWLVITPPGAQGPLAASLAEALAGEHAAVNDVSGGLTTIVVSGPEARAVLARGCTLDLHPSAFGAGACAQTLVAKAGATVRPVGEPAEWELIVRSSFAEYLALWLRDAAGGCGAAAVHPPGQCRIG